MAISVGDRVPEFALMRGSNDSVSSSELLAQGPVAFHFFPFAFTGSVAEGKGCEAQVCGFGARLEDFASTGVRVVTVSHDSPFVLKAWKASLDQSYDFLSDYHWEAAKAFGILHDEEIGFRPINIRACFIVDGDGVVRYAEATSLSQLPDIDAALAAAKALAA